MKLIFWVDGKDMFGNNVYKLSAIKEWSVSFPEEKYVFIEKIGGYDRYAHKSIAHIHGVSCRDDDTKASATQEDEHR